MMLGSPSSVAAASRMAKESMGNPPLPSYRVVALLLARRVVEFRFRGVDEYRLVRHFAVVDLRPR